jgi:hypothetical protein
MIKIYPETKVYIACPANYATGGPELLHQLCYHLREDLKINAIMYYYNYNQKNESPVHVEFIKYNNQFVLEINVKDDDKRNILIVPEVKDGLLQLAKFKNIRKGVWLLSVDFYYLSKLSKKDYFLKRAINKLSKILIKKPLLNFDITSQDVIDRMIKKNDYTQDALLLSAEFYLFQSWYAFKHFDKLNPKYYLSDYLNTAFLEMNTDLFSKENIVVYNPKKGYSFTRKIISFARDIKFIPLENMSRDMVIKILQKAKVYIDFGIHPGKDRLPREAAILGCCVITGRRGSAAFFEDVPIPNEYKFNDTEENIPRIVDKIKDCFENFEERYKDFEYYRNIIKSEPKKFLEDLKKIFVKVEK